MPAVEASVAPTWWGAEGTRLVIGIGIVCKDSASAIQLARAKWAKAGSHRRFAVG
jgi:hypothetical protein